MLGRPGPAARILLLVAVAALVLEAGQVAGQAPSPLPTIGLTLGSDGTLTSGLGGTVANGSALRYAMDGYFGPLIESLPGNNSSKASLLATINATENNPLLAGLFGDRDGRVDGSVDVPRFESLLLNEAKLVPLTTITGVLNVTLDGKGPTSERLQGIYFNNAPAPDSSPASIFVSATVVATFAWSGIGATHTFEVAWNLPSVLGNLTGGVQAVNISVGTPSATTITSVTGLNGTQISNDPLGSGEAHASGQYTPLPGHTVVVQFGPAFPTGDALILGSVAILAGLGLGFLLLRRRRRRRNRPVPISVSDPGVGPSSGSG